MNLTKLNFQISGLDHYRYTSDSGWTCFVDEYVKSLLEKPDNSQDSKIIQSVIINNESAVELKSTQMALKNTPLVSLVIVNWNGEQHLDECLQTILDQTYKNLEVVIVDHDLETKTKPFVERFIQKGLDIKYIARGKNYGFNNGNNVGIKNARGEILFFVNNDVKLDKNCINNALNVFEKEENVGAVFPKLLFYDRPALINALEAKWHYKHLWIDYSIGKIDLGNQHRKKILGSIFAAVFITKEAINRVGNFDESLFTYAEDLDICYRINSTGYNVFSEPQSFLYHKYRSSSKDCSQPEFGIYYSIRNYAMIIMKNIEFTNWAKVLPRFFKHFYLKPIKNFVQNKNYKKLFLYFKIIIGLNWQLPGVLIRHIILNSKRKVADSKIWDYNHRENYDIFFYDRKPVINKLNLETAKKGSVEYTILDQIFETF